MDSGKERPDNFTKKDKGYIAEAGQYEVSPKFGSDTKTFTISKSPLRESKVSNIGPGEYDVARAESAIKCRNPKIMIDSGKERPDNFTRKADYIAEPGTYAVESKFGENAKGFRITQSPVAKS